METMVKELRQPIHSGHALMKWRRNLGISRPVYAVLSNCSERTLATHEAKPRLALEKMRALNESHRLLVALGQIMEPAQVSKWLTTPNEWFEGQKPLAVIRAGRADQVWDMIRHTREGGYA